MQSRSLIVMTIAAVLAATASPAAAWHANGHDRAARAAVRSLPESMPAFFRDGAERVAHFSGEPDVFTRPIAPEELHDATTPDHYFDIERLGDAPIPRRRYELIAWCVRHDLPVSKVGLAPYALEEWTQRLTVAFAEHRRWPDNEHVRAKALIYAGFLAHFAADLYQPLHTTIHYDGRVGDDGESPHSGIHLKVDALAGKLPDGAAIAADPTRVKPFERTFEAILAALHESHGRVDRVYELADAIPAYEAPLDPGGDVAELTQACLADAALFTARLYATAWRDSGRIELPEWHVRPEAESVEGEQEDARSTALSPAVGKASDEGAGEDVASDAAREDGRPGAAGID